MQKIYLRPVTLEDIAIFDFARRQRALEGNYNFFGFLHGEGALQRDFEKNGLLEPCLEAGKLSVVQLREQVPSNERELLLGSVSFRSVWYGPPPGSRAYNIGIELFPAYRGKGVGSLAQRHLAQYLFRFTTVNRVEASTDVQNIAEQRALEKAGFSREGILRKAQFRDGLWHDLVSYSVLRSDFG